MKTDQFYPRINQNTARQSLAKSVTCGFITQREADLITAFIEERQSTRADFGAARYTKYMSILKSARKNGFLNVEWDKITITDFIRAMGNIKAAGLKPETQKDYIVITKLFYTWLHEEQYVEQVPNFEKKLSKIQAPKKEIIRLDLKTDILTKTEIQKLIAAGKTTMEKAMFSVWYECALRPNEVAGLQWKDITPTDGGANVHVRTTKTRYYRDIPLILYWNNLLQWKNSSKYTAPNDFIFCLDDGNRIPQPTLAYTTKTRMEAAGCKTVPPYHIRHSRAMHLILEGLNETVLKMILEGHTDTDILKHYITPDEQAVRDELMKHHGLIEQTENQKPLKPQICPCCNYLNTPDSHYCRNCGTALTKEEEKEEKSINQLVDLIECSTTKPDKNLDNYTVEELLALIQKRMGNQKK